MEVKIDIGTLNSLILAAKGEHKQWLLITKACDTEAARERLRHWTAILETAETAIKTAGSNGLQE